MRRLLEVSLPVLLLLPTSPAAAGALSGLVRVTPQGAERYHAASRLADLEEEDEP